MKVERTLFETADKMRGAMDAGEYKHVALGLLFLRYVSAAFELKRITPMEPMDRGPPKRLRGLLQAHVDARG